MQLLKIKKYKNPLILVAALIFIRYLFVLLEENEHHIIITLVNFALIFTVLFYGVKLFIKKKKIVLVNIIVLFLLLFFTELIFYFVLGMPNKIWNDYPQSNLSQEHIGTQLGNVSWADSVWHDVKINGSDTIFDVYYTVDSINRRVTLGHDESKTKFAVFFGCSICYGTGLKDNQTIPFYVQENTESYNSYNYSFNGWGCNHMLARLEHKDLSKEVKEKEGIGVYIFIWAHIRRAIGDMRIYNGWGWTMPYYYSDSNGEIVRDGNFGNGRWFTSTLYETLNKSYTWDYFNVNLPLEITQQHMVLAAKIIKKSKEMYIKQFGNDNFYVVIHPIDWIEFTPEKNEQFKKILKEEEIDYLDYSQKIKLDNEHIIIGDGHPNEKSNQKFAKLLIKDLRLK